MHEYLRTGKDKDVVDPDPDKIYSRRKERSSTTTNISSEDGVSVQFPVDGWSTSLEKMPMFTRLEMNFHIGETLNKSCCLTISHILSNLHLQKCMMEIVR